MESVITLNEAVDTKAFYGINNANILCLTNQHPDVRVVARGYTIKVTGAENAVARFTKAVECCEQFCIKHGKLDVNTILDIIHGATPATETHEHLILHGVGGKPILARTANQQKLVNSFQTNDLLFAIGPAGAGKTYTAIALAVRALKNKEVKRIILSRPAVEAGEKLGFLPGDMREKVDPYLQPLYDALQDMIPSTKLEEFLERGVIQIAPLAFMRGRTLSDAVVILDEAQNTTVLQMKMFLTRMGLGSKMIVTGDLTQIDLAGNQRSGLPDAMARLENIKGIELVRFNEKDIVRHHLVTHIVNAYAK